MLRRKLLLLSAILLRQIASAQPITVKGSVTDELGLSVIGGSMPQA